MRRFFAQWKEYDEMEEANVPYRDRNLILAQKRHILRARRRMIAGVSFVKETMDLRAQQQYLLPMLKRTSFEFNVYAASSKFMKHLKKM